MENRISIDRLEEMIENPEIAEQDFAKYFTVKQHRRYPFIPDVTLNNELIDGVSDRGQMALNWLNEKYAIRRQNAYHKKIKNGWQGLRFIAEGDSWFQYPHPLTGDDDVIDYLSQNYAIYCESAAGDTMLNMMDGLKHIIKLVEKEKPDGLLFSGGGNDIAGPELAEYIRGYQPGFQPANYISIRFTGFLREIGEQYEELFARLLKISPKLKIFCHGYDWPHPQEHGDWLGPQLAEKEVPKEMWYEILRIMIDRFNNLQIELAGRFPGQVYHVDCRGVLGPAFEWRDELHGKPDSVSRIAKRFNRTIERAFQAVG